jgi:hypothetical protein
LNGDDRGIVPIGVGLEHGPNRSFSDLLLQQSPIMRQAVKVDEGLS